jgi:hypothetical protein
MKRIAPLLLSTLLGCSAADDSDPSRVAESIAAITDGSLSPAEHDASVLIVMDLGDNGGETCSGVLIAPNLVLVAHACLAEVSPGSYSCSANGEPIVDGEGGGFIVSERDVTDAKVYVTNARHQIMDAPPAARGVELFTDGGDTLCSHDFGVLLLDDEIDTEVVPRVQLRLDTQVAVGERVEVIGWGMKKSNESFTPIERNFKSGVPITTVGPLLADPGATGEGTVPRTFTTGPALCLGDSGAMVRAESGAVAGMGVRYFGAPVGPGVDGCSMSQTQSVYMQLAPFRDVIDEAFAASGYEPWLEGDPPLASVAEGGACSSDQLCQSEVCGQREGDATGVCTKTCSINGDCAADQTCQSGLDGNYCFAAEESGCAASGSAPSGGRSSSFLAILGALAIVAARRRARERTASGRGRARSAHRADTNRRVPTQPRA